MKDLLNKNRILLYLIIYLSLNNLAIANDFDTNLLKLKATNSCVMCNLNGGVLLYQPSALEVKLLLVSIHRAFFT
jgi:hypothetical protein